jgi:uncharacterized protein
MSTVSSFMTTKESRFTAFVKRNQLLSMYVILFLLAWPDLILEALHSQGFVAWQTPMILSFLTGLAPGISAMLVSAIIAGRAGMRELLSRFLIWRVGIRLYLVGLFLLATLILGGVGLHVMFGGVLPVIPAASASALNIVLSFAILMVFGALINWEEIAWRGFALPRLQAKYGVLLGCILLAIPETLLHLPYFWNKSIDFYQTVGMFWFSAFSVAMVFIYAFVFNKTKGSLLIVTLMHASQNAWANLLSDNTARPFQFTVALAWMIVIALIFLTKGQLGYASES